MRFSFWNGVEVIFYKIKIAETHRKKLTQGHEAENCFFTIYILQVGTFSCVRSINFQLYGFLLFRHFLRAPASIFSRSKSLISLNYFFFSSAWNAQKRTWTPAVSVIGPIHNIIKYYSIIIIIIICECTTSPKCIRQAGWKKNYN